VGVNGVQGAERVDEGGAGFEGGVGVDSDATVAAGGDGHGQGDELASFFAEVGVFGVGVGEGLVAADRVGCDFHEVSELGADLFQIIILIEHH